VVSTKYTELSPEQLADPNIVRALAQEKLDEYAIRNPAERSVLDALDFPVHVSAPNPYLLKRWVHTGKADADRVVKYDPAAVEQIREQLRAANLDWTYTTATTLEPAIRLAKKGKTV